MEDHRFDELMEDWVNAEGMRFPDLRPPEELRRRVAARRHDRGRRVLALISLAGAAAALLFGLIPLIRGDSEAPSSYVGARELLLGKGPVKVLPPGTHRGARGPGVKGPGVKGPGVKGPGVKGPRGPGVKGPKKGGPPFRQLLLQYHRRGTSLIRGIDLAAESPPSLRLGARDDYRLVVLPERRLQLYVFQEGQGKELQTLFPTAGRGSAALRPNWTHHIPSSRLWYYLKRVGGEERLIVVTSPRILPELTRLQARYRRAAGTERVQLAGKLRARFDALRRLGRGVSVLEYRFNRR